MATYNINVRTASHVAASVPVEATDLTSLRVQMSRFVGRLLTDHAALIWVDEDWRVDVTDETGLILYVIDISTSETAATIGSLPKDTAGL